MHVNYVTNTVLLSLSSDAIQGQKYPKRWLDTAQRHTSGTTVIKQLQLFLFHYANSIIQLIFSDVLGNSDPLDVELFPVDSGKRFT